MANAITPEIASGAQAASESDPLVAALPPATDYLTYLTLLEYHLTPYNLSTLNKLLQDDRGTLAEEIGWDLPKLVLPMLREAPDEARTCLEIVARKGNPREVVVRVAEELERLGNAEPEGEGAESDLDQASEDGSDHGGPTFPGEAKRIHLGRITLEGMPPNTDSTSQSDVERGDEGDEQTADAASAPTAGAELETLLNMLSIVHPRVKTPHPSRFLATSLPAALGAYRRIPITPGTTSAFLSFLSALSGTQRPPLPPRMSTASVPSSSTIPATRADAPTASLPDPEANIDSESSQADSENERAIVARLLQAVLLEVLEEFIASLGSSEVPHMSWTARLREVINPLRVIPGRQTELQKWQTDENLRLRDAILVKFLRQSDSLRLDITQKFREAIDQITKAKTEPPSPLQPAEAAEEPPSEYPTSPSQIPFPLSGIFFLFCAKQVDSLLAANAVDPSSTSAEATTAALKATIPPIFPALVTLSSHMRSPISNGSYAASGLVIEDALLSLLLLSSHFHRSTSASQTLESDQSFQPFLLGLCYTSASCPDPSLRDSAHAVASKMLHADRHPTQKIDLIKSILQENDPVTSPATLHAVVVDWLKDEFLAWAAGSLSPQDSPRSEAVDPVVLHTDATLSTLLFPSPPPPPPGDSETAIPTLLAKTPFYISSLNLYCILRSNPALSQASAATTVTATDNELPWSHHALKMLSALEAWRDETSTWISGSIFADDAQQHALADIAALDDACRRARALTV